MIVTAGVDTHTDVDVAAALNQAGRVLATSSFQRARGKTSAPIR